jgi:hypothetical protein
MKKQNEKNLDFLISVKDIKVILPMMIDDNLLLKEMSGGSLNFDSNGILDVKSAKYLHIFASGYLKNNRTIGINIGICRDSKDAGVTCKRLHPMDGGLQNLKEGTQFSARKHIGEHSWYAPSGSFICGYDGVYAYSVSVSPNTYTNLFGERVQDPINADDYRFLEKIAVQMVHRATALGVTSAAKEKAPAWAKKQVEERLAKLKNK